MRVTLLDLGVGNVHSLAKALSEAIAGAVVRETNDIRSVSRGGSPDTDLLILPGVGAFSHAAAALGTARDELRSALAGGLPTIGICLGMQLLFESSEEGAGQGIGHIRGQVTRLTAARTPHMGWSRLAPAEGASLELPSAVYFAHSFACRPTDKRVVVAWTTVEGDTFPAIVRSGRAVGLQFHPEKSSTEGLALLGRIAKEITA